MFILKNQELARGRKGRAMRHSFDPLVSRWLLLRSLPALCKKFNFPTHYLLQKSTSRA